ncbi:type II toxin-antitoxin system RelE/ParE family toxin [Litorilituus sediminis]|uniref:Toxin n=1 Tax=Litorilituus sediminis TaxID=718192 RepID=A0A4P6P9G9_9GAMM|nr:type II toxin-antitoxin system RelE/ParE family toxin [Litorilituus sediminis]QBG36177.1 type II toxin-antitoxin system RelE/ParE family toxin [Litorilituus sediminis]
MASYKLSSAAESDLKRIWFRGLDEFGETQADAYYYRFIERFEQLAEQPYIAPAVDDIRQGYRRAVCGVDNIYYRIHGDSIKIMRVLGRQDAQLNL